jgi:ribosome-associated protein
MFRAIGRCARAIQRRDPDFAAAQSGLRVQSALRAERYEKCVTHVAGQTPTEPSMIRINDFISIDESEISETFIRSSGPGGQNVNKLATAVQLRFDVRHSPSLTHEVRARLERLAGRRLTRDGVLVITAHRHRTQERNRDDALERLVELIRAAAVRPTPRRPTRPTLGSKVRRLEGKKRRSDIKAGRQGKPSFD